MRRILFALGALALLAGPALADSRQMKTDQVQTKKLQRWGFDTMGQQADATQMCNGAPAAQIEVRHTPADIAAGILSAGFYTPVHVNVVCATR